MESNVMSWGSIVDNDIDLKGYAWQTSNIPIGSFEAVFDFKVWSKKISGINCYFTLKETGQQISLTLFRMKDETYRLYEGGIDFRDCPTQVPYRIETALNRKGNVCFKDCVLL